MKKRHILTAALTVFFAIAFTNCGGKDDGGLLLPISAAAVSSTGGNQGVPGSGTENDPAPASTPQASSGTSGSSGSSGSGSGQQSQTVEDIVNSQPIEQDGTSSSSDIYVENGAVVLNLDDGSLTTSNGSEVQVTQDGALVATVAVVNVSQGNSSVAGTTTVASDDVVFVPDAPLNQQDVYGVQVTPPGGATITENVYLAVDNTCNANSLFAGVTILTDTATKNLSSHIVTDNNGDKKFIVGWDFANGNFTMKLNNKTSGHKYVLTAYGVYGTTGHTCEVYFQRWKSSGNPVQNVDITSMGTISVDPTDSSIPKPGGGYYDFAKTYVQLNVYDGSGNDVSATDAATITITKQAASAARTVSNETMLAGLSNAKTFQPRRSGLLAFMGRSGANAGLLIGLAVVALLGLGTILVLRRRNATQ